MLDMQNTSEKWAGGRFDFMSSMLPKLVEIVRGPVAGKIQEIELGALKQYEDAMRLFTNPKDRQNAFEGIAAITEREKELAVPTRWKGITDIWKDAQLAAAQGGTDSQKLEEIVKNTARMVTLFLEAKHSGDKGNIPNFALINTW